MEKIELKELVGGGLQEQFGKSFEKVVENLQNPNTPYKNVREISIKLKFSQNEKRDDVKCAILVSEKLAPQAPMETGFAIGTDLRTGTVYAKEYGKQLRGQMDMADVLPDEDAKALEPMTDDDNNVVDFRNIAAK